MSTLAYKNKVSQKTISFILLFAYFLVASLWVFWGEAQFGHFEILYGHWYRKTYIFPLGFWLLTFGYALGRSILYRENLTALLSRILSIGLLTHLVFLYLQFLLEKTAGSLNSNYFTIYCNAFASMGCVMALVGIVQLHQDTQFLPNLDTKTAQSILNSKWVLLSIFLMAFVFRGLAAYRLSGMELEVFLANSDDAQSYYRSALKILNGERILPYISVGEQLAVAALLKLSFMNVRLAVLLQAFICSFTPVFMFLIGCKLASRFTALIAALGCVLSQILIFNASNFTRESFGGLLVVISLWCFFKLMESKVPLKQWKWGILFSLATGILFLFDVYMQLPFLILILFGVFRAFRMPLKRRVLFFGLFIILPKLFTIAIQSIYSSEFAWFGRSILNARILSVYYNPYARILYEQKGVNLLWDPMGFIPNFFKDFWGNADLFAKKLIRDFLSYFFEAFSGAFDPVVLVRNSKLAGNLNFYLYFFGFYGFYQMVRTVWRNKFQNQELVEYLLFVLFCIVPYLILFVGTTRYRSAIQPLIIFFCAYGLTERKMA